MEDVEGQGSQVQLRGYQAMPVHAEARANPIGPPAAADANAGGGIEEWKTHSTGPSRATLVIAAMLVGIGGALVGGVFVGKALHDNNDESSVLAGPSSTPPTPSTGPVPVIFDTDYGMFIDDVFALGLLLNSGDLLNLKMVATSASGADGPHLAAKCAAKHLNASGRSDIVVAYGSSYPPYAERGGVCANPDPGFIPNVLEDMCQNVTLPVRPDAPAEMAKLILESGRRDWLYIAVGGQSTLKDFISQYPGAAAMVDTLVIMGGNWCGGFEPYPAVMAPTDETNIACDPASANYVVNGANNPIKNVVYVPVVVADEIGGADYKKFVDAAKSGDVPSATATLEFYQAWSAAGRADNALLIHKEALQYDPDTESTPQFDACAIMVAMELVDSPVCKNRSSLFRFEDGVRFLDVGQGKAFPESPRSAFSLHSGGEAFGDLPPQCPRLTQYTFDKDSTPAFERPVRVALGYASAEDKAQYFSDMATRLAGGVPSCSA